MTSLIRPNTCSTCAYRHRRDDGGLYCRANPPVAAPIPVPGRNGAMELGWQSSFPPVLADWWCGRFTALTVQTFANDQTQSAGLATASK